MPTLLELGSYYFYRLFPKLVLSESKTVWNHLYGWEVIMIKSGVLVIGLILQRGGFSLGRACYSRNTQSNSLSQSFFSDKKVDIKTTINNHVIGYWFLFYTILYYIIFVYVKLCLDTLVCPPPPQYRDDMSGSTQGCRRHLGLDPPQLSSWLFQPLWSQLDYNWITLFLSQLLYIWMSRRFLIAD